MQAVRIAKFFFQAISFVIFAYQAILAVRKFSTVSSIPSVETVDISDAKLPAIYICLKNTSFKENLREQGYLSKKSFREGWPHKKNSNILEGNNSLPYRNLTRQVFKSPREQSLSIWGNPSEIWKFPRIDKKTGIRKWDFRNIHCFRWYMCES